VSVSKVAGEVLVEDVRELTEETEFVRRGDRTHRDASEID